MMRDNYIFAVNAREVITTMFFGCCSDHKIELSYNDKDALRCAVTVFCNDIKNYLIDYLDVDQDEHEHFDLDESDPGKWEVEKTVVYPRKGGE